MAMTEAEQPRGHEHLGKWTRERQARPMTVFFLVYLLVFKLAASVSAGLTFS